MKKLSDAVKVDGTIDPKHEIEILCANCGFDVDESELEADTCSDCGQPLNLKQNTRIYATTVPAAQGSTLV